MARRYGLLLDIFGSDYALVSHSKLVGAQEHAVNAKTLTRISEPFPAGLTVGVDPYTGKTDLGGTGINLTHCPELINDQKASPVSTLLQAMTSSSTNVRVPDASIYTIPGYLWIEQEAVYATSSASGSGYDDITVTRAELGTTAREHPINFNVYGFNPTLEGRKVRLKWVSLDDTGDTITRFVGYIDSIQQTQSGVRLTLVSGQQKANDSQVIGGDFASGVLRQNLLYPGGQGPLPPGVTTNPEEIVIRLKDKDTPFPSYGYRGGSAFPGYVRINDELIRYQFTQHPLYEFEVSSVSSQTLTLMQTSDRQGDASLVQKGDIIDIEDASGDLLTGGEGLQVLGVSNPTSRTATFTLVHNGNLTISATDVVVGRYQQMLRDPHQVRAVDQTIADTHQQNDEVSEMRRVEEDALTLLRQILFSLDGDGTNGPDSGLYDVLPSPWGLGLSTSDVDNDSLDALSPYSSTRRYYLKEGLQLSKLISWLSTELNCFLVFCEDGQLRAIPRGDVYPLQSANHTVGSAQLNGSDVPALTIDLALVKNSAKLQTDYDLNGQPTRALNLSEQESSSLHGRLELELSDPGLTQAGGAAVIVPLLTNILKARSRPLARFNCQVLLDPNTVYRPGQIVSFTLPHFANLQGGSGFSSSYFEILRVQPVDPNGLVELELLQKRTAGNLGRICFAAIVQSVASNVLTLEPASDTHFSPSDPDIEPANGDGTEDVEWFLQDDPITIWDQSSLGGTINSHDTTISSINPGARTITLASTPGSWTIAAGDIVRLDRWQDVGAGATAAERQDVYLALADESTEVLGTSDDAYKWGL